MPYGGVVGHRLIADPCARLATYWLHVPGKEGDGRAPRSPRAGASRRPNGLGAAGRGKSRLRNDPQFVDFNFLLLDPREGARRVR